jgi:hypothetical protein
MSDKRIDALIEEDGMTIGPPPPPPVEDKQVWAPLEEVKKKEIWAPEIKEKKPVGRPKTEKDDTEYHKPGFFRGYLASVCPTPEHVKVYKRLENGKMALAGSYSPKEIERSNDIEEFIRTFLVPKYGGGDYEVVIVNGKGQETRTANIPILDPNPEEKNNVQDNALAKTLEMLMHRMERLEERLLNQPKPVTPTIKDQLEDIEAIKKMSSGNDSSAIMMMMNRQFDEMKSEISRMKSHSSPLPPPINLPPSIEQPPLDIAGVLKTVFESAPKNGINVSDILELIKKQTPEQTKSMSMLETIQAIGSAMPIIQKSLGLDQISELQREIRDMQRAPSKGLKETLDDLAALQRVIGTNRPAPSPEGETFWGFLNNLVLNLDGLGELVKKFRAEGETKQLPPKKEEKDDDELDFPGGYEAKFKTISDAKDDLGIIEATLKVLQWLAKENTKWRKYILQVVGLAGKAKGGDEKAKASVLKFVENFATGATEGEALDEATAEKVKVAFKTHIDKVIILVTSKP